MKKLKFDKKRTLYALLRNSQGAKFFRSLYFFVDGKHSDDILKGGKLSCAFYVSVILKILGLINEIHATVRGTIEDMKRCHWRESEKLLKGAVILWEKRRGHYHLGFYLGDNKAISNSSKHKSPRVHPLNYNQRKIEKIFIHQDLI